MNNQELIKRLKRDIEDWEEQARLWESSGKSKWNFAMAKRCRAKAKQWAEVIKLLDKSKG